eukprot:4047199-Prymnesium_polylepis.1
MEQSRPSVSIISSPPEPPASASLSAIHGTRCSFTVAMPCCSVSPSEKEPICDAHAARSDENE